MLTKIIVKQSNFIIWITAAVIGAFLVTIVVIITVLARKKRGNGRDSNRSVSFTQNGDGQINISPTPENVYSEDPVTAMSPMAKDPHGVSGPRCQNEHSLNPHRSEDGYINLIVPRSATGAGKGTTPKGGSDEPVYAIPGVFEHLKKSTNSDKKTVFNVDGYVPMYPLAIGIKLGEAGIKYEEA